MEFQLNNFLLALSDALDFVEIDILGATSNHSKRVAYIALLIGEAYQLSEDEMYDLCSFALLHDNGLCQEVFSAHVTNDTPEQKLANLEGYRQHCTYGENNVKHYPFLTQWRNVILYHHEHYDGSGYFGKKGDEIPLMAQIVALADTVDNLFHFEKSNVANRDAIKTYINDHSGTHYAARLVETFNTLSSVPAFWLNLQEPYIYEALSSKMPDKTVALSVDELYEITRVFSAIVDAKSAFTARHSSGLEEKVGAMSDYYGFAYEKKKKLMIAASLHDLGKLAIPNKILDNPGKLEYLEMEVMKSHTYYTVKALQKIDGFEHISKWAANHHEKLDGSGYPFGYDANSLGFEERLMGCLDMYQALTEDRPYRKGMGHEKAMAFLVKSAASGLIDGQIVSDINKHFCS